MLAGQFEHLVKTEDSGGVEARHLSKVDENEADGGLRLCFRTAIAHLF